MKRNPHSFRIEPIVSIGDLLANYAISLVIAVTGIPYKILAIIKKYALSGTETIAAISPGGIANAIPVQTSHPGSTI